MFLTGVWYLNDFLDLVRNLAWVFPDVSNTLRSVKAKIEGYDCACGVMGWEGGVQLKIRISSSKA